MTANEAYGTAIFILLFYGLLCAWFTRSMDGPLVDDPRVRHDERTEGVVEHLRDRGGA